MYYSKPKVSASATLGPPLNTNPDLDLWQSLRVPPSSATRSVTDSCLLLAPRRAGSRSCDRRAGLLLGERDRQAGRGQARLRHSEPGCLVMVTGGVTGEQGPYRPASDL